MTLPSRHRIRKLSPGRLKPSTQPLGHEDSPQFWIFTSRQALGVTTAPAPSTLQPHHGVGISKTSLDPIPLECGGPTVVVSTAALQARVWGSVPGLGGLKETNMFLPHPHVKLSIVGGLRDREVACSASDRQGSNFESCVWRTVSSHSSHHPQEVLLAQFSPYVHKGGLKPDSFHFQSH